MTVTLLKRLATLAALVCLAATLNTSAVGAQESRPGSDAALAGDQTPGQQINRLYGAIFDRAPDDGGFAFWTNELTSGARNLQQIADAMVGISPEFADTYGDLNNRDFVNRLYLNVQGRPGEDDPSGSDFWTNQLDSGALTRGGVVLGFSESVEYRVATGSTDPVARLYCTFFLRNPDAGGEAFYRDQYLVSERSLTNIAQEFTQSPEFTDTYGSLTDRQFVDLIYRNVLGRDLPLTETEGPNFWTSQLNTSARTRGEVMVEFSESPEYGDLWTRGAPCPAPGTSTLTVVDDAASVTAGTSVDISWDVNDTLPTGSTVAITTQGTNGTAVDNVNGTFTYTPTAGTTATSDSFTYTVTSGSNTDVGTVTITISAAGTGTAAVADRFIVFADTATTVDVLANDAGGHTVTSFPATTANGTLAASGSSILYTPENGYTVERDAIEDLQYDTFTYSITETATGVVSTATVELVVLAQPECEVFMNYPNGSTNGAGGDDATMELFFSQDACVEVYQDVTTFTVAWSPLTIDGTAATAAVGSSPLQGLVPVPAGDSADGTVAVAGTAVLSGDGVALVEIDFSLEFVLNGAGDAWTRTLASYNGRGDDVTIIVNPLPYS